MTYTFADRTADRLQPSADLVTGWQVDQRDPTTGLIVGHTLFAATAEHGFFKSEFILWTHASRHHFHHAARQWEAVDTIPADAGFVGHYRAAPFAADNAPLRFKLVRTVDGGSTLIRA